MPESGGDVVRAAFAAFERGDPGEIRELMTEDVVVHRVDPDDAIYHGKDGFFQAVAEWTEDFEEWTYEPVEFVEAGDKVAVKVHQTAVGAQSGVPVESDIWFVFSVRDGRIARLSFHLDRDEALNAAKEP